MGMMFEEQAVIDCLTNTAKYYDMPSADKWTKGIHYGLLHGLDNILDNVKPVDAIPKDQYEVRLKADMVAMLEEIKLEIEQIELLANYTRGDIKRMGLDIIQTKLDKLKGDQDEK